MTLKQGIKFDSPESMAEIPRFIAYHRLDTREILEPIDSFSESISLIDQPATGIAYVLFSQKTSIPSFIEN